MGNNVLEEGVLPRCTALYCALYIGVVHCPLCTVQRTAKLEKRKAQFGKRR